MVELWCQKEDAKMASIGERIKIKRKELGLTQAELGEKLNISDKAVSKWEQGEGDPSLSIVPDIAKVLGVSLDYLLLGKEETPQFSLDDLDANKRALYLIEKDDATNFEKYGYAKSIILLSKNINDNLTANKENIAIRNKIIECQSFKVFGVLAAALLKDLKKRQYDNLYLQFSNSAATLVFDYLDDFVKLCALSGQVELLDFIKVRGFSIGDANQKQYARGRESFSITQDVLDFIFSDKRVPEQVVEYMSKYVSFFDVRPYNYSTYAGSFGEVTDSSNAYRMANNILKALCKSQRLDIMDTYLESMKQEADKSYAAALSANDSRMYSTAKFGDKGYLFYTNSHGSIDTTACIGKIETANSALEYAFEQKDKVVAKKLSNYNGYIKQLIEKLPNIKDNPNPYTPDEKEIEEKIEYQKKHEEVLAIRHDTTITDYERRRKLFEYGICRIGEVLEADDYDLFEKFPIEKKQSISVSAVSRTCKDIRFYIYAVSVGQKQDSLDTALADILQTDPERYDILDVLLSAGAQVKDNPAMTAVLKQNMLILNKQKELGKNADVEINNNETKQTLLNELEKGRLEYVIVNLTVQLEKKLKAKLGNGIQLLEMIDMAHNNGTLTDVECHMLHNLRKARNTIVHQGDERGFYTPDLIKEWVEIVYTI